MDRECYLLKTLQSAIGENTRYKPPLHKPMDLDTKMKTPQPVALLIEPTISVA